MKKKEGHVRVRFAPSPTGYLHIGGARTALFNWLFARHHDGVFFLRIEDTDKERSKQIYTDALLETLSWLGLESDEPLVYQASLVDRHKAYVEKLLAEGYAYKCYCSAEEIEARVGKSEHGVAYDKKCRTCTAPDGADHYVVRFKLPDDRIDIVFNDVILGEIRVPRDQLDDFIIARSDGSPVYNLVVVVDDATMNVSHVIRGQDHITNTAKQILLYEALGLSVPIFAHIPLILGSSGQRLSKRDAATAVGDYRAKGYLPEAFLNYLVRLGWSHGNQEIFSQEELISLFTLNGVGKSNAVFDEEKLRWVNSEYLKNATSAYLLSYICTTLDSNFKHELADWSDEQLFYAIEMYKGRVSTLVELCDDIKMLYNQASYDKVVINDVCTAETRDQMYALGEELRNVSDWELETLTATIKNFLKMRSIKMPRLAQPIRLALTGTIKSPGVYALLYVLGKKESLKRIEALITYL